jgi:hypothetical protein
MTRCYKFRAVRYSREINHEFGVNYVGCFLSWLDQKYYNEFLKFTGQ